MKLIDLLNKIANGEIKEDAKFRFVDKEEIHYIGEGNICFNLGALNEKIEIIEDKSNGRWKPKEGEYYWYIDTYSCFENDEWIDDDADNWRYATKNVFKTKQDAEEYFEYKTALSQAEKPFVEGENNYKISFNKSLRKLSVLGNYEVNQGTTYLGQDRDIAQAFLDKWYKQIMKYEFGIEE